MQSINVTLGVPRYGWLPFEIKVGDYILRDEASDLGLNVIDQIIDMAGHIRSNKGAECYFYLEPSAYFLKVEPNVTAAFLQIQYTEDFDNADNQVPTTIYHAEIDSQEFINELIKALKTFGAYEFGEDDWPTPEKSNFLNNL